MKQVEVCGVDGSGQGDGRWCRGVQEWRSSAPCKSGTRALLILLDTDYLKDFFPNYTKDHLYE